MSRSSTFLLLGILAASVSSIHARYHFYEREWNTGGVTGHSTVVVQDNFDDPNSGSPFHVARVTAHARNINAAGNGDDLFTWANKQFEMLARLRDEQMSNRHVVVLVNGVPMRLVVTNENSETDNYQETLFPRGEQVGRDDLPLQDQEMYNSDYEEFDETSTSSSFDVGSCIWRMIVVTLMLGSACTFCACVKHTRDVRRAKKAAKAKISKKAVSAEKVPLLAVLAPEGMTKEPAVIHITSADVEYTPLSNGK